MQVNIKLDRVTIVGSIQLAPSDFANALVEIGWTFGYPDEDGNNMFLLKRRTGDIEENKAVIVKNEFQPTWRLDTSNHLNKKEKQKVIMALMLFKFKHLSRIDIAIDFINGNHPGMLHRILKPRASIGYIGENLVNEQGLFGVGMKLETLYVGKRRSLSLIRYYDKRREQTKAHKKVSKDIKSWERLELQLRGDRTEQWLQEARNMLDYFKLPTYEGLEGNSYFIMRGLVEDPNNWQRLSSRSKARYRKKIKQNEGFDTSYADKAYKALVFTMHELNDEINSFLVNLNYDLKKNNAAEVIEDRSKNDDN